MGNFSIGNMVLTRTLIPDDANTVSHVIFTPAGLTDLKGNAWSAPVAPPVFASGLPVNAFGVSRTNVGVFSDSNYFTQGSSGAGLPNINGAFTACFAFTATSIINGPIMFSNYSGVANSAGYLIQFASTRQMSMIGQGFAGPQTTAKIQLGSPQIVCVGAEGTGVTTGYIKLNSAATVTGAITYNKSAAAVTTFGRYGSATGYAFNGTIEEAWFSTDAPSTSKLDAIYLQAVSQPGSGYRFLDTAGTVLHLLGRDYNGTTWVTPQATLTTVGTVGTSTYNATSPVPVKTRRWGAAPSGGATGTLGTSSFFRLPTGSNVLDFAGDWSACVVVVPTAEDISATSIYASNGVSQGTPGWQLVNETGSTRLFGNSGTAVDVAATAGQLNVICFGKTGGNLALKVNDLPMKLAAGTITPSGSESRIGMHWDYAIGFGGTIYEAWFSTTSPTDGLFTSIVNSILLAP